MKIFGRKSATVTTAAVTAEARYAAAIARTLAAYSASVRVSANGELCTAESI